MGANRQKEYAMGVPHVLFILTNAGTIGPRDRATGFYFPEVAHPFEVFDGSGIAVEYASPRGGSPPEDGYDASDAAQRAFRESKAFGRMSRSRRLSEIDVRDYDAIFFPGGLGPMVDLAKDEGVKLAVKQAWAAGRIVGAVCHGPAALLGVTLDDGPSLVRGRRITGFSNAEEDGYAKADVPFLLETALREQGALFEATKPWEAKVAVDGRLMTGQNPASAAPLAQAMRDAIRGRP